MRSAAWTPQDWVDNTMPTWKRLCDPMAEQVSTMWSSSLEQAGAPEIGRRFAVPAEATVTVGGQQRANWARALSTAQLATLLERAQCHATAPVDTAATRQVLRVDRAITVERGDKSISIFPFDGFKVSYAIQFDHPMLRSQKKSLDITETSFVDEIAPARTFGFLKEVEMLRQRGLALGGSLDNAVVLGETGVLNPLRFDDEFVRHKMLDIVGDLSLLGRPLLGHVVAIRPSHTGNCELTKQITTQMRKPEKAVQTFTPPPAKSAEENPVRDGATLDVMQVMKILPHRPPFLMVDLVTKIEGNLIVAQKNVTMAEPVFEGHFPGHPILPGVLQLEAMAQVASILLLRIPEHQGKLGYFMSADNVKWRKPVMPGDILFIETELLKTRRNIAQARGRCIVNGQVVSEAELMFTLVDR